jgi:hypothetical protein
MNDFDDERPSERTTTMDGVKVNFILLQKYSAAAKRSKPNRLAAVTPFVAAAVVCQRVVAAAGCS